MKTFYDHGAWFTLRAIQTSRLHLEVTMPITRYQPSIHQIAGNHRPASEMSFEWSLAGRRWLGTVYWQGKYFLCHTKNLIFVVNYNLKTSDSLLFNLPIFESLWLG